MKGRFLVVRDSITNFTADIFVGFETDANLGDKVNIAMDYLRSMVFKIIETEKLASGVKIANRESLFTITVQSVDLSMNYPVPIIIGMNSKTVSQDVIEEYTTKWRDKLIQLSNNGVE